ncbi:MAG: MFS transporter [Micrococcales bacterium]|nr:MFS transporter [Micrococcales bacterium]
MDASVRRASSAVFAVFFACGWGFASWAARLPAVRDGLGLRPDQMGVLLLVASAGSLVALPMSGLVVQRWGARRTVGVAAVGYAVVLTLVATGVQLGALWVALVPLPLFGVFLGVWDAAMNVEGTVVEQQLDRTVMPRYHAGFSLGTVTAAGVAAVMAWLDVPVVVHLPVALGLAAATVLGALRWFVPEAPAVGPGASQGRSVFAAWTERRTLLVGIVVLGAALAEGAGNDWLSLAVVDGFATSDALGAAGFALFVVAMTGARFVGTGVVDRWGRVAVLRVSAVVALAGLAVFVAAGPLWLALVGATVWGAGVALGFPAGMSAAGDDPAHAPARVAVVSTMGYMAFLVGPPLLGLLAQHVGYRHALAAVALPVVVGLVGSPVVAPLRRPARAEG